MKDTKILPVLEPNFAGSPEDEKRADNGEVIAPARKTAIFFSRNSSTIDFPTTKSISKSGGPRLEKPKIFANQIHLLESNSFEILLRYLKEIDVFNSAI
ncbi:hypothetical protein AYI70_g6868 [Smittium culicis]|uniref:Uncharacterized protein n=1 Tax=Smittium culicis TaxID=133412 RepID=A0A1R1XN29_9FUNG|nr:hypothetical protein AYI70_g6868 [Smittium culicis]